mmetsp:Transcript_41360/g.49623  ORF Transcript_41360/g.49623 Transcript_41360/m.49623 type:complete len:620 (+) Transcript_41360:163-2022(+)|eukprot:CAMPEP_0194381180 /NCGR_PEP_ID=MMETSP0174-20130528/51087_1 /TAXON_ID=216777 /ORGANISM="Proboscia alata, Strain PI-D3" /LENGTH=619 /DNA_ID=CAMNT_0039165281 /DNA_START=89 /DNA_END=1948 /DNA_ORIENTATION=-
MVICIIQFPAFSTFALCLAIARLSSTSNFVEATSWVDPDTPKSALSIESLVLGQDGHFARPINDTTNEVLNGTIGKSYKLVMSDEFNQAGRSFKDGHDPIWTALNKNDYTNQALHYYHHDNAQTSQDGHLEIITEAKDTTVIGYDDTYRKPIKFKKHFRSAMINSWNKFCVTGGIIEAEVQLPGFKDVGGLWPALWLLGNLARHTFDGTSKHIWPWSTHECTEHNMDTQKINGCLNAVHYGLQNKFGRGAPEIDIFEIQAGNGKAGRGGFWNMPVGQPFMSASYQVSPGRKVRPWAGHWPGKGQWYEGLSYGHKTCMNLNFFGSQVAYPTEKDEPKKHYWADSISSIRQLEDTHFTAPHKYRLEWGLPSHDKNLTGINAGYLSWFLDDQLVVQINGTGLIGSGSIIPDEPMYLLINTAIGTEWGFPGGSGVDDKCKKDYDCNGNYEQTCGFPPSFCSMIKTNPTYKMNWIRVYQNEQNDREKIGCSTPERPTKKYIEANVELYKMAEDEHPLKVIQVGGGACDPNEKEIGNDSCGGQKRGNCRTFRKVCQCEEGWAGPHCLAHDPLRIVEDHVIYQVLESIEPIMLPAGLAMSLISMAGFLGFTIAFKRRLDGWKPINA